MTYTHNLSPDEFNLAKELAEQTLRMFSGRPGFYNNNINSHLRGKIGEIAVSAFLAERRQPMNDLWRDISRIDEPDIVIPDRIRVDVKTWDSRYWAEYGRCISVSQFPKLRLKADVVVWCTSDSAIRPEMSVIVEGWSTMNDIDRAPRRHTGPAGRRQVYNYQLDATAIRDLETLLAIEAE